ncbi:MAG: hypothetical protein GY719_25765 [bacterium]|nr:hypothetical protein [bacterium]
MPTTRRQRFAPQRARRLQEALARKAAETVAPAELFGRTRDASDPDHPLRQAEEHERRQAVRPVVTGQQAPLDFAPIAKAAAQIVMAEERKAIDRKHAEGLSKVRQAQADKLVTTLETGALCPCGNRVPNAYCGATCPECRRVATWANDVTGEVHAWATPAEDSRAREDLRRMIDGEESYEDLCTF